MNGEMTFGSWVNPKKAEALAGLRAGKLTVAKAAKIARVSERSIIAWAKIHGVRIPAEKATAP